MRLHNSIISIHIFILRFHWSFSFYIYVYVIWLNCDVFAFILTISDEEKMNANLEYCCSGWGATGISDTYTVLLYELAFTATRSVSGYCCKLSNVELG